MKVITKIIIAIIAMLTIMPCAKAEEKTNTIDTQRNIIKLNCGTGMLFSKIYDNSKRIEKNTSSTLDLSLNYIHLYDKKHGYIFDLTYSNIIGLEKNELFLGAGIYGIKTKDNGWYYDGNLCIGYMRKDFGQGENGIALKGQIGGGYKLSEHLSIGANLGALAGIYMDKEENYNYSSSKYSIDNEGNRPIRLTLSIGVQYYF